MVEPKPQRISITDDKTAKKFSKDKQSIPFVLSSKNSFLTDKGVKHLLSVPNSRFLREMDLSDNYSCITDDSLLELSRSAHANALTRISLKDTEVTDYGLKALIDSQNFSQVRVLSLYGLFTVTDQTMIALAESDFVWGLESLCLRNTGITDKGLQILSLSPNSAKLVELDISENFPRVSDSSLAALSMSEFITRLKVLNCMGNRVSDRGLGYLMESRNVLGLEDLDVSEHIMRRNEGVTDASMNSMAVSNYLRSLRILNLRSTNVGSKGLIEFFASYNCFKLEVLRISNNPNVNDIVLLAIMESDNLNCLRKVYINDTSASPETIENLKKKQEFIRRDSLIKERVLSNLTKKSKLLQNSKTP